MPAKCPNCGAIEISEAGVCSACGTIVPDVADPSTVVWGTAPPQAATKTVVEERAPAQPDATVPTVREPKVPATTPRRILGQFGRFELLAELGSGGFGSVYKATDPQLDRTVAVKIPNAAQFASPEVRERFVREARSAARLSHPNIVPVYEVGDHEGLPFLVSEFIDGQSLASVLHDRRLPIAETVPLVIALADALHYAHELGVIHRDVKPANVLIDLAGTPRLTDFGLAKRDGGDAGLTTEGQVLGTPSYMSPEQARGEAHKADRRSDVYSLGAMLYQLLTGEVPFRGNIRMTLLQVMNDDPRPLRELNDKVPRDLETICLKCLEKDPARRYATARELSDDLRRFVNSEPVNARPASAWDRARKFARRNRTLVVGTAATVFALLLGVAGTTYGMVQARDEARNARTAQDTAEKAERARTVELANTRAGAARLAAQRGQWREALEHSRAAIELGAANEIELRLGMLEAYNALYDFQAYRSELASLAARSDLGPHRGMVRLYQGLSGYYSSDPAAEPVGAFREALAAGLPPAEESYARGVTASAVPEMIAHLRAAIRADPFHVRAHDLLTLALMISGQAGEAREVLTRFELLAPNAINTTVYRILDRAIAGDLAGAHRLCDASRVILGEDGHALFRSFASLMHGITREETFWEPNPFVQAKLIQELTSLAPRLSGMLREERLAATWGAFNMFRLGIFRPISDLPVFRTNNADEAMAFIASPQGLKTLLAEAKRVMPMGVLHYAEGTRFHDEGKLAEAEAAFRKALETPSLIPVARRARFALLGILGGRILETPQSERARRTAEIRETLWRVFSDGPYPVSSYEHLVEWALEVDQWGLALAAAEEWVRLAPESSDALLARGNVEMRLGAWFRHGRTMNQLLVKSPNDPWFLNSRTLVETIQNRHSRAIPFALEAVRRNPDDADTLAKFDLIEHELDLLLVTESIAREKARLWRLLHLTQIGNHRCAAAGLPELPVDASPETLAACAMVLSRAASSADADKSLTAAERVACINDYLRRGLALLKRIETEGRMSELTRDVLRGDGDLRNLVSHPACPAAFRLVKMP